MAVPVDVPHFDLPFRFQGGSAVVVEQDSFEDIANCAEAIIRTPYGFRTQDGTPDFGLPLEEFGLQPIGTETIRDIIVSQEPRVIALVSEHPDQADALIDDVLIQVIG